MERLTYKGKTKNKVYCEYEMQDAINKLADYEDKQEQGLLIELPCKVGDKLYSFTYGRIVELEVLEVKYHCEAEKHGVFIRERIIVDCEGIPTELDFADIGNTVFLTCSEAEEALAKMGGSHEDTD